MGSLFVWAYCFHTYEIREIFCKILKKIVKNRQNFVDKPYVYVV